jgi:hypothetical protein
MMRKIDDLEVWNLFGNSNGLTEEEKSLEAVWVAFVAEIQTYCREEHDLAERIRTLRTIRRRLVIRQEALDAIAEKKMCPFAHTPLMLSA